MPRTDGKIRDTDGDLRDPHPPPTQCPNQRCPGVIEDATGQPRLCPDHRTTTYHRLLKQRRRYADAR